MDGSTDTPEARTRLRWYLKRILSILRLPEGMAFASSGDLERHRDDCGRAAYNMAFWTVEEFDQFNLPAPPNPSAQQPGLSAAQLIAWTLGILRRLDGEDVTDSRDAPRFTSSKRFAIALSFPGERRDFVERVASCLAEQVGQEQVLYDKYHEAEFAQPDLDVYLPNLYGTEAELIVIFLCADYAKKRWCKVEWRSIRQLVCTSESRRIMFVSFDEIGAVPELGILSGDGYLSVGSRSPDEVGTLILQRVELNRQKENRT